MVTETGGGVGRGFLKEVTAKMRLEGHTGVRKKNDGGYVGFGGGNVGVRLGGEGGGGEDLNSGGKAGDGHIDRETEGTDHGKASTFQVLLL